MKTRFPLVLAIAMASTAPLALAAGDEHHAARPAASSASTAAPQALTSQARAAAMERMQGHMQAMHAMHDKMMAAKTPEERDALMAEHARVMQDGMTMMKEMAADNRRFLRGNPTAIQLMDKRMEMMQGMMEMMMDRLPPPSSK